MKYACNMVIVFRLVMIKQHSPISGFTLIELMVTVSIISIVALIAVPAFNNLIQDQRAAAQANSLLSAVSLARTEAVRLNAPVQVSQLGGGIQGWCVHTTDACNNNSRLQEHRLPANMTVTNWQNMLFDGRGRRLTPAAGNLSMTLRVTGCTGERARQVIISPIGQGSLRRVAC